MTRDRSFQSQPARAGDRPFPRSRSYRPVWAPVIALAMLVGTAHAAQQLPNSSSPTPGPLLIAPAIVVEQVEIRGVRPDRRPRIRRLLAVQAETPIDEAAIEEGRLRLLATGLFKTVEAHLKRGSAPGRVILVIDCEARETLGVDALHLGHARPTDLWVGAELSDLDPLGMGVTLAAGLVSSGEQTAFELAYAHPRTLVDSFRPAARLRLIDGREPFVGPRAQQLQGEPVDAIEVPYRRLGLSVTLDGDLGPLTRIGLGLDGEHIQANSPAEATETGSDGQRRPFELYLQNDGSWLSALSIHLTHDSRDDPAHPSEGWLATLGARASAGSYFFIKMLAGCERYIRLPAGHVLRLDATAGAVLGDAPFFERFFVGDLHPYIPARALGLNFARRRGPVVLEGSMDEQRYESVASRLGVEYRLPLGASGAEGSYRVELFIGGALLALLSPDEPHADNSEFRRRLPVDAVVDLGLRIESEIGVMGLSLGNLFLIADP